MEIEVAKLKIDLKQWELTFLKSNGRKPTKNDADKLPEIKKKYDKFTTLKKAIQKAHLSKRSENKENEQIYKHESNSEAPKTVPLPKNKSQQFQTSNTCCLPAQEIGNCVWGANLLKKNAIKNVNQTADDLHSKEETKNTEKEQLSEKSTASWRDNIRKNIGFGGSEKRLPSTLKTQEFFSKFNDSESPLNSTLGLDQSFISTESKNVDSAEHTSMFGSQVQILKKADISSTQTARNFPTSALKSSPFISPFGTLSKKRTSMLSRQIEINKIEDEDLSDLKNLEQEKSEIEYSEKRSCQVVDGWDDDYKTPVESLKSVEVVELFKDETESFIETNFRDKPNSSHFSFSSDIAPKINYDAVCLDPDVTESKNSSDDIGPTKDDGVVKLDSGGDEKGQTKAAKVRSALPAGRRRPDTNFIRLNMKQKCFSRRGGGGGRFLRKQVFREKLAKKGFSFKSGWKGRSGGFRGGSSSGKSATNVGFRDRTQDKCYKCGGTGHWANKCNEQRFQKTKASAETEAEEKEAFDDIMENIDMIAAAVKGESTELLRPEIAVSISEPLLAEDDTKPLLENKDVKAALKMFKFSSFRPGQAKAIGRILRGLPTLLVLSTGSGKSLCYQLPAYLYATQRKAITLVISPLVSLMDDQVRGLPRMMKATRIHSGMTKEQRNKAMAEVESGKVHVLLVSPEAITSWAGMSPKYSPLARLPPIAFACIDECHCMSEWSHAFRPSYLRVCQVLRDQLGVKCLVGLTATATMDACASVARQLGIHDISEGVIAKIDIPDNLVLTVSKDRYKDNALLELLLGDRFSKLNSVIVYCTRRDEASRIASLLRVKMQDMPALEQEEEEEEGGDDDIAAEETVGSRKRKRGSKTKKAAKKKVEILDAECYHAGMSAAERKRIQNKFMNGTLRVVVATVAFGMGIDKHDVRSVIHYNMPMSFERYVQEVGRAGRDGKPAHCHLFLDSDGHDLCELSRHSYAKAMDRYTIKKFIKMVFPVCGCTSDENESTFCGGHSSAIEIDSAIEKLDVKREGLETLLCYLEIEKLLQVHLPTETKCTMQFYGGPGQMINTAKKVEVVAQALKLAGTKHNETKVDFNAMKVADEQNMELSALKRILRYLTYDTTLSTVASEVGKSGIEVEFSQKSFCIRTKQKTTDDLLDAVTDLLHKRVIAQENKEIAQLKMCFNTMQKFSYANVGNCRDAADEKKIAELKRVITDYFKETQDVRDTEGDLPMLDPGEEAELGSCIRQFLHVHADDLEHKVTGRAIARIFHGIDSPCYPAKNWGPVHRFWRSKLHIDFNVIRRIATEEIVGSLQRL